MASTKRKGIRKAGRNVVQGREFQADVAVVGYGASGLAAALTAAYGGATVTVLEKMPAPGGTANFSEGLFAVESPLQRSKHIAITRDQAFKKHMEYSHWRANPRLVRAFIDKSASTIDWLQQQGVEFIEPASVYPGAPPVWHLIRGRGATFVKTLAAKAKEIGVNIQFRTPGKKLLTNDDGAIAGVIAEDKTGNTVHARAEAVIIATGGFANNADMLDQYTKAPPNLIFAGNTNKTGDGIRMAWEVHAAREGTEVLQLTQPVVRGEGPQSHLVAALIQPYLWINQQGERFCDETITFQFPLAGNALANQKGQIMYIVFDEKAKKYMIQDGVDIGMGVYLPVATRLLNLDADIQRGVARGEVFVADSVRELADVIGVDRTRLNATVQEYNTFCEQRHDDLFAKDPDYLRPITEPKFYAIRGHPGSFGTLGGIKINDKTEVLNKDHEVIPGLYAVGCCAGGLYGDSYDLATSGGTLGFAVNSGRIAGENALKYIGKQ